MDKRYLYQVWRHIRIIKPWYIGVVAIVATVISVTALRDNNLRMAQLRTAVFDADKNNGNVQRALQDLQVYVTNHMNTDLTSGPNAPYPPIQLANSYDRAVHAAGNQASASNAQIYNDAQHYCEKLDSKDYYGTNRVHCVQQYVREHDVANVPTIPDSLYMFDFASPSWSPDVAGWSLLLAVASYFAFAVMWVTQWWLKRTVK